VIDDLRHLWGLKGLDEERAALLGTLSRFPVQRREAEERVKAEEKRLEQLKQRINDLQKVRREREREIEAVGEQERKFQSQLPSIRKNEEYTALLHEIELTRGKRSELETVVLMALEEEEGVQREKPALEQALRAAQEQSTSRQAAIEREEREARVQLDALEARRQRHLEQLAPATRSRYERIHSSRDGRAVVTIAKGACGGCFRAQPPQTLNEARRGDRVLICDGCGRIVIWPPEAAA
jgi:predicted  nucleic acid-binding Zn-ribbon protein